MSIKKLLVRGAYVLVALVLLLWIAVFATQTNAFREWARGLAERQVTKLVNGEVTIGRLEGNIFTGAQLSDVRVKQDGREIVVIERATARYDVRRLLQADLALTDVTLFRPRILLVHGREGWRIAQFLKRRSPDPKSMRTFAIEALTIEDGSVVIEDSAPGDGARLPERFHGLDANVHFFVGNGQVDLDIARSTFRTEAPTLDVRSAAGRLVSGDRLQLQTFRIRTAQSAIDFDGVYEGGARPALVMMAIAAAPLHIDEFATYIPALAGRGLIPTLNATLHGRFDALDVNATVTDARMGAVRAQVIADLTAPTRGVRGAIATERLDLAVLLNDRALASRLTANMDANLTFSPSMSADAIAGQVVVHSRASEFAGYRYDAVDGTVTIAGRRFTIAADTRGYGASARVNGTLTTGNTGGVGYDLQGHVRNVDLRTLPPQLHVPSLDSTIAGTYTARGVGGRLDGTIAFDASTVEGIAIAAGSRGRIGLTETVPSYGFEGHVADLDIERLGRALNIETLSTERYASDLTGRLTVDGAGDSVANLRIDATAQLEPSTIFDTAFNAADIDAHIADRTLSASVKGNVTSVDLSRLTQREQLEGKVSGEFDVRATITDLGEPVTLDTVTAEGTAHLGPSTIGPLRVDEATFEGKYADRGADVTTLTVKGPDVDVTASGPLMLGHSGESQLTYHIAHGRLEDLASLVGRDIAGRVTLDGTVAGNATHLTSKGTAAFSPLRVDTTFDALQLNSTFDASLDDLRTDTLRLAADLESTLPSLGGQSFRSLSATVVYEDSALQFDTTLEEEGRTVTGMGQLRVLEDGREIRVEQLAVAAGKTTWSSPAGKPFTATFGSDGLLRLDGVELTSGEQRLMATGTLSMKPGVDGALDVRVEQGNLTELGTMLLVQRMLGGALNATGTVTGDPEHRLFAGQVAVANGLLDGFKFQSLDAALRYDRGRVGVDATLLQSPGAQLSVKGEVGTSAEGTAADDPIDLNVKTDGIDLAVLQTVTTSLDAVSGLLRADVHLGGTTAAPRIEGAINVEKGAFTLTDTGTKYTGATLDVALKGDQLRIERLHLQDENGRPLDGSGHLSIEGRSVQNIDVTMTASEFKVLNNELGDLSINATLNVVGTVLSPKITGLVRVHAGRLEVDAFVDRFTSNAYATTPSEPAAPQPEDPSKPIGPAFDVTVEVPGNLVLRGTDIRPADATVGLGDMNVTVGGNFSIRKDPGADPVLRGSVTTIRGSYDFQGRRFELLRDGTIAFRGERPIDPALNLQAERVISGIVAHVNIGGTMRSPSLMLSSRPPLDEADILSLIVFNQPVNKLGEGQRADLGTRAVGLASGLVVSPISDTLEHALDVDLFEIETGTDDGDGPAITVGEQVGERLFVKLRQIFGSQPASEVRLEYQLTDFLRLEGSIAEGGSRANRNFTRRVERRGIDLVVFFSY